MNKPILYQEHILDHYKNPRHKGSLQDAHFTTALYNPSCGDSILFQGIVQDGKLVDIAFEGSGCVISLATASLLSELVLHKPLHEIINFTADTVQHLIQISLGPQRLKCALLPLEALQKGIRDYLKEQHAESL